MLMSEGSKEGAIDWRVLDQREAFQRTVDPNCGGKAASGQMQ